MEQAQQEALIKQWLKRRLLRRWLSLSGLVASGIVIVLVLLGLSLMGTMGGESETAGSGSGDGTITDTSVDGAAFHAAWLKYYSGGVMKGQEQVVIEIAKKYGISPALMAAIIGAESGWGTSAAIRNKNNPSGQMVGSEILAFPSLKAGIEATGKTLNALVVGQGLSTVETLGSHYAPVGAANDPTNMNVNWVPTVKKLMMEFGWSEKSSGGKAGDNKVGNITLKGSAPTYPIGQCTWWAKARSGWAGDWWGNGEDWGNSAKAQGFRVDHVPAKDALVSFAGGQLVGNWRADSQYGHVAYVEAYDAKNKTITISQGGTGFTQQPGPNLQTLGNVNAFTYIHPK